jgi:hypothetical protein
MDITLVQTKGPNDFKIPELTKRAHESSRSKKTRHYKALAQSEEVAFVSLDRWPELSQMVIYEIFVPRSTRRQGIASAVLNEVERISACEGLSIVRLAPAPLDAGITKDALYDWYGRRGYVSDPDISGELFKVIGGKYWQSYDKFGKAVYILATEAGDVRSRLLLFWQRFLRKIDDEHLPDDLLKDLIWIKKELHKFHEEWRGQLNDLKQKEKIDPTFKEKYAHLYPDPVEATLGRIRRKSGAAIASRIYSIYDALKVRRC